MKGRNSKGFTLIELMITVAIVALLAAVAVPAYQKQVQKTRRADGIAMMMQIAQQQERHFSKNFTYGDDLGDLGYGAASIPSDEGHYNISTASDAACITTSVSCFVVTATAVGAQLDDTDCRTFTVNQAGVKASKASGGTVTTSICY